MRSLLVLKGLLGLMLLSVAGAAACASEEAASVSASRSRSAQALPSSDSDTGPAHVVDLAREFHDSQCANGGLPVAQCPGVRRVRLGEARVNGALSSEIIRRVVQRHAEELRLCYEREPGAAARLAGSLSLVFTISAEGVVQAAKVEGSTLDAAGLDACLVKGVGRWVFPAPAEGSVEVTYPLFFEAG